MFKEFCDVGVIEGCFDIKDNVKRIIWEGECFCVTLAKVKAGDIILAAAKFDGTCGKIHACIGFWFEIIHDEVRAPSAAGTDFECLQIFPVN